MPLGEQVLDYCARRVLRMRSPCRLNAIIVSTGRKNIAQIADRCLFETRVDSVTKMA